MRDRLRGRERGMTAIGLIILIAFVGLFVYAGIRLVPLYVEYFEVVKAITALKPDASSGQAMMQVALEKRFDIEDIHSLSFKDVEFHREGSSWTAHAEYDAQTPFVGNVGFIVHFDKTVDLGSAVP